MKKYLQHLGLRKLALSYFALIFQNGYISQRTTILKKQVISIPGKQNKIPLLHWPMAGHGHKSAGNKKSLIIICTCLELSGLQSTFAYRFTLILILILYDMQYDANFQAKETEDQRVYSIHDSRLHKALRQKLGSVFLMPSGTLIPLLPYLFFFF